MTRQGRAGREPGPAGTGRRGTPDPPRLGTVPYVNALPLVRGLDPGCLHAAPPSALAAGLLEGRLDAALLPVAELLRHPQLEIVGDGCIASRGRVDSVLLLLRRAPHRVGRLALDPHSRTSQLLARLVLERRYGAALEAREHDPVRAWEEGRDGAVLVIGDAALRMRARGLPHLDLGAEWYGMTGLPFVFAAWTARAGADATGGLARLLDGARFRGLRELPAAAREGAAGSGLPRDLVRTYLERRIRFRLGPEERAGLRRFLHMARSLVETEAGGPGPGAGAGTSQLRDPAGRSPVSR